MNASEERMEQPTHENVEPQAAPRPAAPPPPSAPGPVAWRDPRATSDPRRKSPLLACLLSVMPGLGQVYVGYYRAGFTNMGVWAGALALTITVADQAVALIPLGVIFLIFFFLYNIIDAGRRAAFYNQALAGIDGVDLPAEMDLPAPGGSVAGGVVLIVVGLILLSHTRFGVSLDWLEDWWPAAPIALGAWLVYRGIQEKK